VGPWPVDVKCSFRPCARPRNCEPLGPLNGATLNCRFFVASAARPRACWNMPAREGARTTLREGILVPQLAQNRASGPDAVVPHCSQRSPSDAAYLYFFTDALAVRRADAPPMSAVLVPGLHMLLPHVAAAHLLYKTGRTLHANSALVEGTHALSDEVQDLTSHQFASADPLVLRLPVSGIATCFVRRNAIDAVSVVIRPEGDADDTKLKSSLPVPAAGYEDFRRLLEKAVTAARVMDGAPPGQAP